MEKKKGEAIEKFINLREYFSGHIFCKHCKHNVMGECVVHREEVPDEGWCWWGDERREDE